MDEVIVVGGGIVGSSAAYRLARQGHQVTLVDRKDPGQATAVGAGVISPGTSFKHPVPYYTLAAQAVDHYPQLMVQLAADGETNTGYEAVGAIFVATNDDEVTRMPEVMRLAESRLAAGVAGIGAVSRLDAKQAQKLFPALMTIKDAFFVSGSVRVNGRLVRDSLQRAAQRRGARIVYGDARLIRTGNRVTEVVIDGNNQPTGAVIIAGGAWSSALGDQIGLRIPVYPQRGQILHLELPAVDTSRWPIITGFHMHYMLTFPTNRVVAGATREHGAGFDYRMTAGGVHESLNEALRIAPGLANATLQEVGIGFRPASPDQLPIVGRAPGLENVFLATGHGSGGLLLGPYSGAVVADMLTDTLVPVNFEPFSLSRFL